MRPFNYLNSAVLAPFEIQGLDNGSLFSKTDRLGVVAFGVLMTNPPIGHFSLPLVGECHYCAVQRCCQVHSRPNKKALGEQGHSTQICGIDGSGMSSKSCCDSCKDMEGE